MNVIDNVNTPLTLSQNYLTVFPFPSTVGLTEKVIGGTYTDSFFIQSVEVLTADLTNIKLVEPNNTSNDITATSEFTIVPASAGLPDNFSQNTRREYQIEYRPTGSSGLSEALVVLEFTAWDNTTFEHTVKIYGTKHSSAWNVVSINSANSFTMNTPFTIYELNVDLSVAQTAVAVGANYVSLEQNGHQIIHGQDGSRWGCGVIAYPSWFGGAPGTDSGDIVAQGFTTTNPTARGVTIRDSAGGGSISSGQAGTGNDQNCHSIYVYSGDGYYNIHNVVLEPANSSSNALFMTDHRAVQGLVLRDFVINSSVTECENRHQAKGYMVKLWGTGTHWRISDGVLNGGCQGGIVKDPNFGTASGLVLNHTSKYRNGFGIGGAGACHMWDISTGAEANGRFATLSGDIKGWNLTCDIQERVLSIDTPNLTLHDDRAYGVQMEPGENSPAIESRLFASSITVRDGIGGAYCVRSTGARAIDDIVCYDNTFSAIRESGANEVSIYSTIYRYNQAHADASSVLSLNNTCITDQWFYFIGYEGARGFRSYDDAITLGSNPASEYGLTRIENSNVADPQGVQPVNDHKIIDPVLTGFSATDHYIDTNPVAAVNFFVGWTHTFTVTADGAPADAATITATNPIAGQVYDTVTDSSGEIKLELVQFDYSSSGGSAVVQVEHNPVTVQISKAGFGTFNSDYDTDRKRNTSVNLTSTTGVGASFVTGSILPDTQENTSLLGTIQTAGSPAPTLTLSGSNWDNLKVEIVATADPRVFEIHTIDPVLTDFEIQESWRFVLNTSNAGGTEIKTFYVDVANVLENTIFDAPDAQGSYINGGAGLLLTDSAVSDFINAHTGHAAYTISPRPTVGRLNEADSPYTFTFMAQDAPSVQSNFTAIEAEPGANPPILSIANAFHLGSSLLGDVLTDTDDGTLHYVVTDSPVSTVNDVKNHADVRTLSVTASGAIEVSWTGLTNGLKYLNFVHTNAGNEDSFVRTATTTINAPVNGVPELKGKTGTGIRRVMQWRRTETTASVFVFLGNVTSTYYNTIHKTALTGVGEMLDATNINSASITFHCEDAPVVAERTQTITGINLEDDLLSMTANASFSNDADDPIDWVGLAARKFKLTQLDDRPYRCWVETNAVDTHGDGKCKRVSFTLRPKSSKRFRALNLGCTQGGFSSNLNGAGTVPADGSCMHGMRTAVHEGVDYILCPDDPLYNRPNVSGCWWTLPRTMTSDEPFFKPVTSDDMIDVTFNLGDAVANDQNYRYLHYGLSAMMEPNYVYGGLHAVLLINDPGDHGFRVGNNRVNDVFQTSQKASKNTVDYGSNFNNWSLPRVTNGDAALWIHDGSGSSVADSLKNPFAQTGTLRTNFHNDMDNEETRRANNIILFDYLCYSSFEHNHLNATPSAMSLATYYTQDSSLTDITQAVGAGGINALRYAHLPRWKYFDIGDIVRIYSFDMTFQSYISEVLSDDFVGLSPEVKACEQGLGAQQLADIIADLLKVRPNGSNPKKYVITLNGDLMYPENAAGDSFGQPDAFGNRGDLKTNERDPLVAVIEAMGIPVICVTSDHHVVGITNWADNVIECHASANQLSSLRSLTVPPEQTHTHQNAIGQFVQGVCRIHLDQLFAYVKNIPAREVDSSQLVLGDVARVPAGENPTFISANEYDQKKLRKVQAGSKNFLTLTVN